jgi:hypothetical protein
LHLLFLATVLSVKLLVARASLDLLDSVPISVVVDNASAQPQTIRFAEPAEYAIELVSPNGAVLWSTPLPVRATAFPPHDRTFAPGPTVLAVYDWNDLLAGGWSPPAGSYVLRARLLTEKAIPENAVRVTFAPPLSPSSVAKLKPGADFTLAGTLDAQQAVLADARGSATLSRRLLGAPIASPVLVRGFVAVRPDGTRIFTVERWARLRAQPPSSR